LPRCGCSGTTARGFDEAGRIASTPTDG
jgi:hypothetical protein